MWVAFAFAKATHIFSAKILAYMPYLMIKVLTDMLTNDIVSFEQLGPDLYAYEPQHSATFWRGAACASAQSEANPDEEALIHGYPHSTKRSPWSNCVDA